MPVPVLHSLHNHHSLSLELPYLNSVKKIFLTTQLLTGLKISTVGFENVGMGDETTSKKNGYLIH